MSAANLGDTAPGQEAAVARPRMEFTDEDLDHKGLDGLAVRRIDVDGLHRPEHVLESEQLAAAGAHQDFGGVEFDPNWND
jgi:hypothetical protein